LTFVATLGTQIGLYDPTPIATISTPGYLYFINARNGESPGEIGAGASYLDTFQISNGSMTTSASNSLALGCYPQSVSLDSTGSNLFFDCVTETEIISLASPDNPVELTTQAADGGVTTVGN
jgi:hypothetical protein